MYSQLLDFLDRNNFNYLVRKYDQLSNRESLRDVVPGNLLSQSFQGEADAGGCVGFPDPDDYVGDSESAGGAG